MIIGVPKEIKNNENRVSLTPAGVSEFIRRGHKIYVQKSAGNGSGFSDEEYTASGAILLDTIEEVYAIAEMIIKVKEPIKSEYKLCKPGQLIYTYFHFAASEELTNAMLESGAVCLAYETVELEDRTLPLLVPMSEVAGRMATVQAAKYIEKINGGSGVFIGGVPGVLPAKVMVIGGGVVGTEAAKMAAGMGADVTILDLSLPRLRYLDDVMPANVKTMMSNRYNIEQLAKESDIVIGAVLVHGAKAPALITKEMLPNMKPGSVIVDVAIDQGGCIETTYPTTHDNPVFIVDDIVHYSVANMPGAVPRTSTFALTNATMPFGLSLAEKGWKQACKDDKALKLGLNVVEGKVVYKPVADAFNLECVDVDTLL